MSSAQASAVDGIAGGYTAPPNRRWITNITSFAKSRPLGAACGAMIILVILVAVFADQLVPYDPNQNDSTARLEGPSADHWLGTDNFGRDVFSRIIKGAQVSIRVAAVATAVSVVLSMSIGVTAAYFRGPWDYITGRFIDTVQALPGIVLLITLLIVFGRGVTSIGIVLGIATGLIGSRVVRGATFAVAAQPFVEVARSVGCSPARIILRHLIPNVVPLVLVLATINVGSAIIAEASLSFIGYGIPPPAPSWGGMLSREGRQFMTRAPWLFYAPTAALAVVVFSINMFGDALRDRLDPRLRGGR